MRSLVASWLESLVFLVAKVFDFKLPRSAALHRNLTRTLREENELQNMVFVSTNYDIIVDNALTEEKRHGIELDYGVDFRTFADRPKMTGRARHCKIEYLSSSRMVP